MSSLDIKSNQIKSILYDCQVSRSQILKSATSYIQQMTDKNQQVQVEINKLKKMNRQLEQQG